MLGVGIATYPLLLDSHATVEGLVILSISMVSYSVGTVYYSSQKWTLPTLAINGWQVLFGGILLLPLTFLTVDLGRNRFDFSFWAAVLWLVVLLAEVFALKVLVPAVEANREGRASGDPEATKRWGSAHRLSVQLNVMNLLIGLVLIFLYAR